MGSQAPIMLPKVAIVYANATGNAMAVFVKPYYFSKKSGNQKR